MTIRELLRASMLSALLYIILTADRLRHYLFDSDDDWPDDWNYDR